MTDNANENTQEELTRLRDHSARLLGELKQAKADAKEAKAETETLRGQLQAVQGELTAIKLDAPVADMLGRIAAPDAADAVRALMQARGLAFALDAKGQPIPTAGGKPATATGKDGQAVPVPFEARALVNWLCPQDAKPDDPRRAFARLLIASHASGGGARSSEGGEHAGQQPAPKAPARRTFGLA